MNAIVKFIPPEGSVLLPDLAQYKGRFDIRSSTSNKIYRISFLVGPRSNYWVCSCLGYMRYGDCKHLQAMGLKGRKYGPQIADGKKYGFIQ
jgi:hypothetical protein